MRQIDRLKKQYDAMQQATKKTGSVLYFEPLRKELNDCFGALKDVNPDKVFSNRRGMQGPPQPTDGTGDHEPQAGTSGNTDTNGEVSKPTVKKSKSNFIYMTEDRHILLSNVLLIKNIYCFLTHFINIFK